MKKFERPTCEITEIELMDVIATSADVDECPGDTGFGGGEF